MSRVLVLLVATALCLGLAQAAFRAVLNKKMGDFKRGMSASGASRCGDSASPCGTDTDFSRHFFGTNPDTVTEADLRKICNSIKGDALCHLNHTISCAPQEAAPFMPLIQRFQRAAALHFRVCDIPDILPKFQTILPCLRELFDLEESAGPVYGQLSSCVEASVEVLNTTAMNFINLFAEEPNRHMIFNETYAANGLCCASKSMTDCLVDRMSAVKSCSAEARAVFQLAAEGARADFECDTALAAAPCAVRSKH